MTSALDLVVFHWVPGLCRSLLVFLLSDSQSLGLSRSEVRGPFRSSLRRRRSPAFSDVRALVSRSFCGRTLYIWQRSAVLLVFLLSDSRSLGPSRSEVRGPFRSSLRRRRFPAFSDVHALVSRSFCGRTLYFWRRSAVFLVFLLSDSRTLGPSRSEVRGPFRSSLRHRRFPALSDVRASVSRSFVVRTLYFWQRSVVPLVFLLSDSRSFEVRGPRSF